MQAHEMMAGPSDCYCNNPPPVQHGTVASTMQSEAFPQNPAPSCRGPGRRVRLHGQFEETVKSAPV